MNRDQGIWGRYLASWQAHLATWIIRNRLKPRLRRARDLAEARRLLTPPRFSVPAGVRLKHGVVSGISGEWVEPVGAAPLTLIYLHGGGYYSCSPKTHRPVTAGFAARGFRVFAPAYRLAPEHPFPAALEDALGVYRGLRADTPPRTIVMSGESAGGGLTLALLASIRDAGEQPPAAAALFSPWTDLALTGDSARANGRRCAMLEASTLTIAAAWYLGGADPRNPLASPLYADPAGFPPLLIHVGENEVLLDDSTRFAARARSSRVDCRLKVWPAVPHAWQLFQPLPEARKSLDEAAAFLRAAAEGARD
jgi:monoterpene epsilon-lactone hydrolase